MNQVFHTQLVVGSEVRRCMSLPCRIATVVEVTAGTRMLVWLVASCCATALPAQAKIISPYIPIRIPMLVLK